MSVLTQHHVPFRAEDLLNPGIPEKFVEIIEGELIVMTPAGWIHGKVAMNILLLFIEHCRTHPGLDCATDNLGFLLERDPDFLLAPDASLFRIRPEGDGAWMEFSPEIAVEVVSPSNSASELVIKKNKYLQWGSEQVWITNPKSRTIEFHHRDGRTVIVQGNEVVIGEGIAEGMEISLEKIFTIRRV